MGVKDKIHIYHDEINFHCLNTYNEAATLKVFLKLLLLTYSFNYF